MEHTRRDLNVLLPALLAAGRVNAQQQKPVLPAKAYKFEDLPVKTNPDTHNESRQVFDGLTHEGYPVDLHITTLQPGRMPHPPHRHAHEEVLFLQTGEAEVTMDGVVSRVGPGSVVYVASNVLHGWKNTGQVPSQYFVLAIGHRSAAT
jgi:mannose-6-phosphate isomerase-like protein (cupin superfamily)